MLPSAMKSPPSTTGASWTEELTMAPDLLAQLKHETFEAMR